MKKAEPENADVTAPSLWTVGHSRHSVARFLTLLEGQGIGCVVDVRSVPYSRRHSQRSRPRLAVALAERKIAYVWEGEALGGRPDLAGLCRPDGRPDWERVRASEVFRAALGRLAGRARREPTAIMCAEEDP